MRRPVKPFVTEYKGNARRSPSPSMKLEEETPAPLRSVEASRFSTVPQGEESYEAALRAADALFSGQRRETSPGDAAGMATDDGEPLPSLAKGGRILRVINEAPSQDLVELEEERAPKRRGRKPGSKNKPKVVQTSWEDAPTPSVALAAPIARSAPPASAIDVDFSRQGDANIDETGVPPRAVATGARRGERYAWVRTQLKPGQSWKRHLPKVIW